jgi:hypothetical protein
LLHREGRPPRGELALPLCALALKLQALAVPSLSASEAATPGAVNPSFPVCDAAPTNANASLYSI